MAEEEAATGAAKGIGGGLKKNVGPLPMGVWIAIIAGGLLIAYYFNKKNGQSSGGNVDTGGNPAVGTGLVSAGIPGGVTTPNPSTQPTDNQGWLSLALTQAIRDGYNPVTASAALNAFINGQVLQPDQATLVQRVVQELTAQGINIPQVPSGGSIATAPTGGGSTNAAPAQVTNLHFVSGTASKTGFTLAWNAANGATSYELHVSQVPIVNNGPYTTYQTTGTSFAVTGLKPNTHYFANVLSKNAVGYGPGSNQLTNLWTLK